MLSCYNQSSEMQDNRGNTWTPTRANEAAAVKASGMTRRVSTLQVTNRFGVDACEFDRALYEQRPLLNCRTGELAAKALWLTSQVDKSGHEPALLVSKASSGLVSLLHSRNRAAAQVANAGHCLGTYR